jgi:carbonic anhydrase/acetyltransferase-like protein (isoleucine patch superfamily)
LGAKSVVLEGREIPDGVLALGVPARVVRGLNEEELSALRESAAHYLAKAKTFGAKLKRAPLRGANLGGEDER